MTARRFLGPVILGAVIAAATPAAASYGATRTVRSCAGGSIHLAAVSGGAMWGATSCGDNASISVVTGRTAGAWRRIGTPWTGRVVAVADDGSTTFVLWNDTHGRLQIGRRPHAGPASSATQLSPAGSNGASLVVRSGRWWAVWSTAGCTGHLEGCYSGLWQAKSLGRGVRPEPVLAKPDQVGTHDVITGLAMRRDEAVLVFLRRDEQGDAIHYATAGLDGVWTDGLFQPAVGEPSPFAPTVAVASGRVIVGWVRNQLPMVSMQDDTGAFVTHTLPYRAQTAQVHVAASGGRAFVGHTSCLQHSGGSTCRVYVSTVTADGTVTGTTELSAGTGPHTVWGLDDLVAAGGIATAAISTQGALVTRSGS